MNRIARSIVAVAMVVSVPLPAGATHLRSRRPDCISRARAARPATLDAGNVNVHGWVSGGRIGGLILPEVPGVTQAGSPSDADVASLPADVSEDGLAQQAPVDVTMAGFLGGGVTKLQAPGAAEVVVSGAQRLVLEAFTGHYRAVQRSLVCESRLRRRTVYRWSYYEVWFTGLRVADGTPAARDGLAKGVQVLPGDTSPR